MKKMLRKPPARRRRRSRHHRLTRINSKLWQAANAIAYCNCCRADRPFPDAVIDELDRCLRIANIGREHGWTTTTNMLLEREDKLLYALNGALNKLLPGIRDDRPYGNPLSIHKKLCRMRTTGFCGSFTLSGICLKQQCLHVTCEEITLGVYGLGKFRFSWSWRDNVLRGPYHFQALTPNPASCDPRVTHPCICMGTVWMPNYMRVEVDQHLAHRNVASASASVAHCLTQMPYSDECFVPISEWHKTSFVVQTPSPD